MGFDTRITKCSCFLYRLVPFSIRFAFVIGSRLNIQLPRKFNSRSYYYQKYVYPGIIPADHYTSYVLRMFINQKVHDMFTSRMIILFLDNLDLLYDHAHKKLMLSVWQFNILQIMLNVLLLPWNSYKWFETFYSTMYFTFCKQDKSFVNQIEHIGNDVQTLQFE